MVREEGGGGIIPYCNKNKNNESAAPQATALLAEGEQKEIVTAAANTKSER